MAVTKDEILQIRSSDDVVLVRQAVRQVGDRAGFSLVDQTKMITAASELARNTLDLRRRRDGAPGDRWRTGSGGACG